MSSSPLAPVAVTPGRMAPLRGPSLQRQLPTSDVASMRFEQNRLASFSQWPLDAPVPKERLAKAGFFYKSAPFRVECFSCGNTIDDWAFNEQAMAKHKRMFPLCPFVQHKSDNVPATPGGGGAGGSPQPTQDSGYSSQSPSSSQESNASTSPRTGFRFPTAVATPADPSAGGGGTSAPISTGEPGRTWQTFSFLKRERQRFRTFVNWPLDFISPADLAAAGFFFLREGDRTQCIFCRGVVGNWEVGDVPMTEHSRHFPQCPFVRGRECGNVPAEYDSDSDESIEERASSLQDFGHDETGHRLDVRTHSEPEHEPSSACLTWSHLNVRPAAGAAGAALAQHPSDLSQLGISEHQAPVHPSYATVESRLRSYQYWPPALAQKPQQLAEAGFFYAGVSDHVKCFHCDGGLRNWVPGDDPWTEHARWFSRCGFVRLVKGEEFVQTVLRAHPQQPPQPAAAETSQNHTAVKRCPLTDQELENMMESAICKTAVELGVAREAVKRVLKERLESTGLPFTDLSSVLAMAFNHREASYLPPGSSSAGTSTAGVASSSSGHQRVGSTLSAASSGADSGMEDVRSQDGDADMDVQEPEAGADVLMTTQLSHESSTSTLTGGSTSSGSGSNTPKVLSPGAAVPPLNSAESSSNLEEEYQRLKEQKQCKVCMDEEVGVVFLPCGHLITCVKCAPALRLCPLCRQAIRGTVRTYLS